MRIYSRKEFMKLPEGTIFAKGKPWYFESIDVKAETCLAGDKPIDFFVHSLNWVEANSSDQAIERLEEMLAEGKSYPMQNSIGRDGMFDDEDIFLVYERDDLLRLKEMIENAINL